MLTIFALVCGVVIGLLPSLFLFLQSYVKVSTPSRLCRRRRHLTTKIKNLQAELDTIILDMKYLGLTTEEPTSKKG